MYLFIKEPVSDDDDDKRLTHFKTRAAKGLARVKRKEMNDAGVFFEKISKTTLLAKSYMKYTRRSNSAMAACKDGGMYILSECIASIKSK